MGTELQRGAMDFLNSNLRYLNHLTINVNKFPVACLEKQKAEINNIEKNVRILDPINVLKRGYSITLLNGKSVNSVKEIKQDDVITTVLTDGSITSTIDRIKTT